MATRSESSIDDLDRRSAVLEAEARLLQAEARKLRAERELEDTRRSPFAIDRSMWWLLVQVALFAIVLMGIGFSAVIFTSGRV